MKSWILLSFFDLFSVLFLYRIKKDLHFSKYLYHSIYVNLNVETG